jgi:hypothetical protein
VHEHDHDQQKTTKELLDITTQHAFGEEAVASIFVQGDGKVVPGGSRWAPPKAADKGAKRSVKGNIGGQSGAPIGHSSY